MPSPQTHDKEPAPPDHASLFKSGEYVSLFQPDADHNPFRIPYGQKRDALLNLIGGKDLAVLDVGGGPGRISIPLSGQHRVTLCDLSLDMLKVARSGGGDKLGLCVADACTLPFAAASFDCVLCVDVLPHVRQPQLLMSELYRVLRPGGRLLIDSANAVPLWTLAYPRYVGRNPVRWIQTWLAGGVLPEWRSRVRHSRRGQFMALLTTSGFRVRRTIPFGPRICPKWHLALAER